LRNLPTRVFHGAKDDVVPLSESERMVRAIERAGGDAKLTVYPDANHNSWTRTYEDDALYRWLLAQRRNIVQH
jgi:dipeptidyl aminopeptidase/acylaminoacyl peptidase